MKLNSRSGVSIVQVLVVLGLSGIASVVLSKIMENFGSGIEQGRVLQNIATLQENVKSSIVGVKAWQKTQENNVSLKCLVDRTDCRGLGGPIVLYNADGTTFVDATLPNAGFNRDGVACTAFDATTGSADCPFRYEVEWEPICSNPDPAIPCRDPQVRVVANLKYKTPRPLTLNTGRFRLEMIRGGQTEDGFCQNMGGIWDAVNAKCDLSETICATMGGTVVDGKCNIGWMDLDCDEKVMRGFTMIGGSLIPDCVDTDTTLDPESLSLVPWNWNDPKMKTIPQEDIVGCVVTPGATNAPNADAGGLTCLRNRAAGYTGTCYYRNTGNQSTSGWFRVGSGMCRGGVYTASPVGP